jgi:hypothetical protein
MELANTKPHWRRRMINHVVAATEGSILLSSLFNIMVYVARFITILPNRYIDTSHDFAAERHDLVQARPLRFNDMEANFFIRLIIEHGYDHVIELGAYHLERAAGLARLFPSTKVYGLDITQDFAGERVIDGVTIGPNTLDHIRSIARRHGNRGLICSRGTLVYYSEDDLRALFALASRLGHDIALSEPNTPLQPYLAHSRIRTRRTFYHPFPQMLREAGFELPDNGGAQIQCAISEYGEERTFIFAQARGCPQATP